MQIFTPMMELFVPTFALFSHIWLLPLAPDTAVKAMQNRGHAIGTLDP